MKEEGIVPEKESEEAVPEPETPEKHRERRSENVFQNIAQTVLYHRFFGYGAGAVRHADRGDDPRADRRLDRRKLRGEYASGVCEYREGADGRRDRRGDRACPGQKPDADLFCRRRRADRRLVRPADRGRRRTAAHRLEVRRRGARQSHRVVRRHAAGRRACFPVCGQDQAGYSPGAAGRHAAGFSGNLCFLSLYLADQPAGGIDRSRHQHHALRHGNRDLGRHGHPAHDADFQRGRSGWQWLLPSFRGDGGNGGGERHAACRRRGGGRVCLATWWASPSRPSGKTAWAGSFRRGSARACCRFPIS